MYSHNIADINNLQYMTYNINIDDYIGRWGFSKQYIRNQLSGLKDKPVNVRISSLGGAVDDGLDIRQQFIDHGEVTAYLYGFVASAATIVASGAKKVVASKYSMYLVHKVSNWVDAWGQYNADQISDLIEKLKANKLENDKFDLVIANMYAAKSHKSVEEILDVLKEGRWLTAQEALDLGFIDEIIEEKEDTKINFSDYSEKFNILGLPALPSTQSNDQEDKDDNKTNTLLNRILSALTGKQNAPSVIHGESIQENKLKMKKDYVKVNSVLNIEGLEFGKENSVALTEDQIKTINDKIDSLESSLSDKDTQIENLKKNPGADTTDIEGGEGKKEDVTSSSMFNAVKDFI